MTSVSYFQQFSTKENHVTNNTLLMLRHVYRISPQKFSDLLCSLIDQQVSLGVEFIQQIRESKSIPDGQIVQKPLNIMIEAKLSGKLDNAQLERHISSIRDKCLPEQSENYLIGLTTEAIPIQELQKFQTDASQVATQFVNITYSQLVEALIEICPDYQPDLLEIIEDYKNFLSRNKLLSDPDSWLVAFPCGMTLKDNIANNLYFEDASRVPKLDIRYLGVYHKKTISYVGKIIAVTVFFENQFSNEYGDISDETKSRIRNVVLQTKYYDLTTTPHRFYIVDQFLPTKFEKISSGGMMHYRYFNLKELDSTLIPKLMSTSEIAHFLSNHTFQ